MTSPLSLMAKILQTELLERGWAPPSIDECEAIVKAMIEKTAKAAERARERAPA